MQRLISGWGANLRLYPHPTLRYFSLASKTWHAQKPPSKGCILKPYLIYGANGFTGRLIVQEALDREHTPILAGRNAKELQALGEETGLEVRLFDLKDENKIAQNIKEDSPNRSHPH